MNTLSASIKTTTCFRTASELEGAAEMAEHEEALPSMTALRLRWDVFLSFRGEDTREGFTNLLYRALEKEGVRVFRDNEGMPKGNEIARSLIEAIEDSSAAIAVISPLYASSRWCLDELAKICECRRLLIPVFYHVDPSDVRRQRGPFEKWFRDLESGFSETEVARWRNAMNKAGRTSGWVLPKGTSDLFHQDREELQLIQLLVRRILAELRNTPMQNASYTVGLDSRVEEVMELLNAKSNGVRVFGFHGPGGIGKTTLAKALYNKLVSRFENHCFISDVRKTSMQQNGLASLQNKILADLSRENPSRAEDTYAGNSEIRNILPEKRVLLILDDVDDVTQLGALRMVRDRFHAESRVVITTRDRSILVASPVDEIYEMKELSSSDSLKLFCYHSLRREKPSQLFTDLSLQIVSLTGGLPLALEVFGCSLFDKRRVEEWEDALQKLQQIRPRQLQDVLKISFDGLDEEEKCIFLDIACLFVTLDMKRDEAIDILKGCGFRAEIAINVLISKSLLKIKEDNTLWMHDQIRDMGRQIVVQNESLQDPGMRSRLWDGDEVLTVLKNRMGTVSIQGIIANFEKRNIPKERSVKSISWSNFRRTWNIYYVITYLTEIAKEYVEHCPKKEVEITLPVESFQPMVYLRLLQLSNVRLEGNFKCVPAALKWLQWRICPLKELPSSFCQKQLSVLDLSDSKIEKVWGWRWWSWHNKVATNLTILNLRGCCNLTAIPDLSNHPSLQTLILERCRSVTTIHKSLRNGTALRHLNLKECSNLVDFPRDVSGLRHLETLILSGCSKLKQLPQDLRPMNSLRELLLDDTVLEKLPESILRLTKLEHLSLSNCRSLKQLPDRIEKLVSLRYLSLNGSSIEQLPKSIGSLGNLEQLVLAWCRSLTVLPESVGNLKSLTALWLNGSSVRELPSSIGSICFLKDLSLGSCRSLKYLPDSIGGLASLVDLQLDGTLIEELPAQINGLKSLEKLEMRNCTSLRSLPKFEGLLTLTHLIITKSPIKELPESLGTLESLIMLKLNKCKQLCKLPSSIGDLKSLHHLLIEETGVTELPESFGMLSRLMVLKMAKISYGEAPQNAKSTVLPSSFLNLSQLQELDARGWRISGKLPDDFEKLSSLEIMNLGKNDFYSLPSSLKGLSFLRKLSISHCKNLEALPPLPSRLEDLDADNCTQLRCISDLSNLEALQHLNFVNCAKLLGIPGLKDLKSLRGLYLSGCCSCCSLEKEEIDELALKNLYNLSLPGSRIPDWFTPNVISYSKPRNRVIKAVIAAIVISINHQIPDDIRDSSPVVPGIEIKILRLSEPVFHTGPYLVGVPNTDEDTFYLCRYEDHHPLVSLLKDGDKIEVAMTNPPHVKGVELKRCGLHLVFEDDDDYMGDEDSVSHKLTKFLTSSEVSVEEVEREKQGGMPREEKHHGYPSALYIFLPFLLLLLSWLLFKFLSY